MGNAGLWAVKADCGFTPPLMSGDPMPKTMTSDQGAASDIAGIAVLSLNSLRAEWGRRWGDPPGYRSQELLARAFAHKLQVDATGDLPAAVQRHISELAQRFMSDRGFAPEVAKTLLPGSSIIREWQGTRHEVAVVTDGFVYQGEKFRSLSRIAAYITGTKWNGPVFFGLKRKKASA
jgi:hypothetical protein